MANNKPLCSTSRDNTTSTPPPDTLRWFEEEAICHDDELSNHYQEDEDDLYNDFLAKEELGTAENYVVTNVENTTDTTIVPVLYTVTDALTEGFGSIFPSYREIIIECIQSVFKIDTPTDWQVLLIQSLVFPDFPHIDV